MLLLLLLQLSPLVKLARQAAIVALKELLFAEVVAHLETSISIRRTRPFFFGIKSNCTDWVEKVFVELLKRRFH